MNILKVLVVDDEKPARDRLRQILEDEDAYEVVGEAANGHEALELAARLSPDVVLLDIRMPGMEGIETAHHLNAMEKAPAVVFTTAYDEYAIDAFEARAIGYVLKPVRRSRLTGALEALRNDPGAGFDFARAWSAAVRPAGWSGALTWLGWLIFGAAAALVTAGVAAARHGSATRDDVSPGAG